MKEVNSFRLQLSILSKTCKYLHRTKEFYPAFAPFLLSPFMYFLALGKMYTQISNMKRVDLVKMQASKPSGNHLSQSVEFKPPVLT